MRRTELCFAFAALVAGTACAADFYVSPRGKDSNQGNEAAPFATVTRAVEAMREARKVSPSEAVTVTFADGVYELKAPVTLDADDASAPVMFAAAKDAKPVLSGGRKIRGWRIGSDGRSWTVELPEVRSGAWKIEQLYVNGVRALRPSLPRDNYFYAEGKPANEAKPVCDRFIAEAGDIHAAWQDLTNTIEFVAMHGWNITRSRIKMFDPATRTVTLASARPGFLRMFDAKSYYRLENVKAAFGKPGEWYCDETTGILSYMPRLAETPDETEIVAPALTNLVQIVGDTKAGKKAGNVTFRGIAFENCAELLSGDGTTYHQCSVEAGTALDVAYADNVCFENCAVRHTGGWAVKIGGGCENCAVEGCELFDLGAGGVVIGEKDAAKGARAKHTHNCRVQRCLIAGGGRVQPGAVGVAVLMAGDNQIAHNTIRDFYYSGISVGYTWGGGNDAAGGNIIEWNHIYDIGQNVLSDLAAIYTLGSQPGTVIRCNLLHDITTARYGAQGLYFDEGSSHITASNNIVIRAEEAAFSVADKALGDIHVENNIFLFSKRYMVWTITDKEVGHDCYISRNIFQWDEGLGQLFYQNSASPKMHFSSNVWWQAAWPEKIFFRKAGGTNTFVMAGAGEKSRWPKWQKLMKPSKDVAAWMRDAPGDTIADPRLGAVYADETHFAPMSDSPAIKLGFVPFDLSAGVGHEPKEKGYARGLPEKSAARAFPAAPLRRERLAQVAAENARHELRMTVFNQRYLLGGAGFAIAFRTPSGRTCFFDMGNGQGAEVPHSCGRDAIAPWLYANNIRSLDGLVISHSHGDHFGGLLWLLDKLPVRAFWDNQYSMPGTVLTDRGSSEYDVCARLREKLKSRNPSMTYTPVRQFDKIDWGPELDVTVITPPQEGFGILRNPGRPSNDGPEHYLINGNALGIRVVYKKMVIQIMGDIQEDYEQQLLMPRLPEEYRHCDILLPCSHGIDPNCAEAEQFRPKVAIGCVFEDGAPAGWCRKWASHLGCWSSYNAVGSKVYVTGVDGNVTVSTDGETYRVDTEFGSNRRVDQLRE